MVEEKGDPAVAETELTIVPDDGAAAGGDLGQPQDDKPAAAAAEPAADPPADTPPGVLSRTFDFAWNKQFLPCGFGFALVFGLALPPPGRALGDVSAGGWSVSLRPTGDLNRVYFRGSFYQP